MKLLKWALVIFAWTIAMPALSLQDMEPKNGVRKPDDLQARELRDLMQRKLENAQKVLEGVALGDFDKIAKHAEELMFVSKQAEWRVFKTPQYEMYSNEFRRAADNLAQKAKDKNLDGAALAYVDLTLTCVRCHKHVREVRGAQLDVPRWPTLVRSGR